MSEDVCLLFIFPRKAHPIVNNFFLRFLSVLKESAWQPDQHQYVRKKLDFTILDGVGFGGLRNAVSWTLLVLHTVK